MNPMAIAGLGVAFIAAMIAMGPATHEAHFRIDTQHQVSSAHASVAESEAKIADSEAEIAQLKAEREKLRLDLERQKLAAQQTDNSLKPIRDVAVSPATPEAVGGETGGKLN